MDNMERIDRSPLAIYRDYLAKGELAYQVVRETGQIVYFPRVIAPESGSLTLDWHVSSGNGTVYATTVMHRRDELDQNLVLVDMDEGFRVLSRVVNCDPLDIKIGDRVSATIFRDSNDIPIPVFEQQRRNAHET